MKLIIALAAAALVSSLIAIIPANAQIQSKRCCQAAALSAADT